MTFKNEKTCCFTGHRSIRADLAQKIREKLAVEVAFLYGNGVSDFVAGGALGFDTIAALTVLMFRAQGNDVRLHLMLPCPDQCNRWSADDVAVYDCIKEQADSVTYICDHYHNGVMLQRNRAMVDASSYCICFFDRESQAKRSGGGTLYTVKYARKKGLSLVNVWDEPPEDAQLEFEFRL